MNAPKQDLIVPERLPIDENPISAYLASLAESSRRPMRTNLETIAWFVSGGRASAMDLAWWKLRYQHTTLIRSTLAEAYAPATANLMLSAVRGVLKACFRLGYLSADDLQRAADIPPVRDSRLPPGRAIDRGELYDLFRICHIDVKKGSRCQGCGDLRAFVRVRVEEERDGLSGPLGLRSRDSGGESKGQGQQGADGLCSDDDTDNIDAIASERLSVFETMQEKREAFRAIENHMVARYGISMDTEADREAAKDSRRRADEKVSAPRSTKTGVGPESDARTLDAPEDPDDEYFLDSEFVAIYW